MLSKRESSVIKINIDIIFKFNFKTYGDSLCKFPINISVNECCLANMCCAQNDNFQISGTKTVNVTFQTSLCVFTQYKREGAGCGKERKLVVELKSTEK